jgi:hypothetical protein
LSILPPLRFKAEKGARAAKRVPMARAVKAVRAAAGVRFAEVVLPDLTVKMATRAAREMLGKPVLMGRIEP